MDIIQTKNYAIELGSIQEWGLKNLLSKNYLNAKVVMITDENSYDYCLEKILNQFPELQEAQVLQLPAGEQYKNLPLVEQILNVISEHNLSRNDLMINLGGGVITDMGGFMASIYKRGIDFINIPTTLLSMVDASIGGKTGVDLGSLKNQIGVFAEPKALYIDPEFLKTLEPIQIFSGYAEMLKHGLIADKAHWEALKETKPDLVPSRIDLIKRSIEIKKEVVEKDFKESGLRKILNFGHTVGHAIEGMYLTKAPIIHGLGVAWGMMVEAKIATELGMLSADESKEIEEFILSIYPPIKLDDEEIEEIMHLIQFDKKNKEDKILCALITEIGKCEYDVEVKVGMAEKS
ncbi:MAG: 3-dehydroquinate synthase [Crocinitomicaceae bacterium]